MAITNYLVHFKTNETFESNKDQLRNDAVAFVGDATIIHTHGTDYYCGSGPVALKSDLSGYATTSALTSGLADKANKFHKHTIAQVFGLQTELDSKLESVSLADLGITATAAELNQLDGKSLSNYALKTDIPSLNGGASATSGQYVSGVTVSGHEVTVTKATLPITTLSSLGITATAAELNYCDGVTSNIQTQLNGKAASSHTHTVSQVSGLADVATSGSYNDLSDKPSIPSLSGYATQSWVNTQLDGYLPLTGGEITGELKCNLITIPGITNMHLSDDGWLSIDKIRYGSEGINMDNGAGSEFKIVLNAGQSEYIFRSGRIECDGTEVSLKGHTHSASDITYGTLAIARIPTGTTSSTVALGNHTHGTNSITTLTGYTEGSSTTTLSSSMSLNTALASLQNQIQAKASSLSDLGITATAAEINKLDGLTATTTELNYVDGVTSNIQTQLNNKAASSHNHSAANITSGTLNIARLPSITDAKITSVSASKITGTIPQANLPSYVDDVLEYSSKSSFPQTGETGKIYVDTATNLTYRWGGSSYVEISPSLALGETSSTAYRGDRGKIAYDHSQATGNPHNLTLANLGINATATELNYIDGVTSNVQTQLNNKADSTHTHSASDITSGTLAIARIPTGITSYTVALGNHTHSNYLSTNGGTLTGNINMNNNEITFNAGLIRLEPANSGSRDLCINNNVILTESNYSDYISSTDTKNTTGTSNSTSKLYLAGGTSQDSTGVVTYSNENVYTQSGQLYATQMNATNGFFETSDARLKNFKDDIKVLNVISEIPTKYFTWKEDENQELQIGTSAQEVEKLYPELVSKTEDDILTVDYAKLSIIALAAIKELKVEIQSLKEEIKQLKSK